MLEKASLTPGSPIYADKGYSGSPNEELLKKKRLKSAIQQQASRNRPLTWLQKRFNKLISKVRYKVEQTFGSIRVWFDSICARYVGLAKMHTQPLMEAMAYNLYRAVGIIFRVSVG